MIEIAEDNSSWGYVKIMATLNDLGDKISDTTVENVLKRHGISPSPDRTRNTSWHRFIKSHKDVLWATDFFSEEVWTPFGLMTVYVLFFRIAKRTDKSTKKHGKDERKHTETCLGTKKY